MTRPRSPAPPARNSGRARLATTIVVAAILVHMVAAWLGREPGVLTGQDDAVYMMLAQSLRSSGYYELHRIDQPIHAHYPPAYPALLAAWDVVAGDGFDEAVLLNVLLAAAALVLLWRTLRKRGFDDGVTLGAVVAVAVNPMFVAWSGRVMSEQPYILLTLLCLFLLAEERPTVRRTVLAIIAAILAALTRGIGITLLIAIGAYWLLERRWKAAAALAVAGTLTAGSWLVLTAFAPQESFGASYAWYLQATAGAGDAASPLQRMPEQVAWYLAAALPTALAVPTVPGTPIDNAVAVLALAVLLTFGTWTLRSRWTPATLYLIVYAALLAVWSYRTERFLIPLLPILLPALLVGAQRIGMRLLPRRSWLVPAAVAGVLILSGGVRTIEQVSAATSCDRSGVLPDAGCMTPRQAAFFDAVGWIAEHTPDDAVFLSAKSATLWRYTGRRSIAYHASYAQDTTSFLGFVRDQGATYVLLNAVEEAEPARLAPLLLASCDDLALAAAFPPHSYLFRLDPEGAGSGDGAACTAVREYLAANEGRVH